MSEVEVFDALKYRIDVDVQGTRWYYNNANQLHRTDGPAVEYADGTKFWCQNGLKHRTDGPAMEYPTGHKRWYQNGKRHRIDGAAIEYSDGDNAWYINGEELTEDEFNLRVKNV